MNVKDFMLGFAAGKAQGGGDVEIVSWTTGTDAQIAAMVAALDTGKITIEQTGWQIGEERIVHLSAMEAISVGESHAAQDVSFVLMDSQHYDLVNGGKDMLTIQQIMRDRGMRVIGVAGVTQYLERLYRKFYVGASNGFSALLQKNTMCPM